MGSCQSIIVDDEDRQIQKIREKQIKKEMFEFQKELRKQKCFSELDLNGKPRKSQFCGT